MRHGVHYYEFPWPDMTAPDNDIVLRSVQVMESHVKNTGKVLVHCHAGLGRTGLMIACFLVYSKRMSSNDAIKIVRVCRPGAVQTSAQTAFVRGFEKHLWDMQAAFRIELSDPRIELELFIQRQRSILHGEEGEQYRYIPKPIHFLLCRVMSLLLFQGDSVQNDSRIALAALESIAVSSTPGKEAVEVLCRQLNRCEWRMETAHDVSPLMFLVVEWFRQLTAPAVSQTLASDMIAFMKRYPENELSAELKPFLHDKLSRVARHSIGIAVSAIDVLVVASKAIDQQRRFAFKALAQALTHTHTSTKCVFSSFELELLSDFFSAWGGGVGGMYFDPTIVPKASATITKIAAASHYFIERCTGRGEFAERIGQGVVANDLVLEPATPR